MQEIACKTQSNKFGGSNKFGELRTDTYTCNIVTQLKKNLLTIFITSR